MVITTATGQHFDLRFEENVHLVPQLALKLAQEASPARDRSTQTSKSALTTDALRRSA